MKEQEIHFYNIDGIIYKTVNGVIYWQTSKGWEPVQYIKRVEMVNQIIPLLDKLRLI